MSPKVFGDLGIGDVFTTTEVDGQLTKSSKYKAKDCDGREYPFVPFDDIRVVSLYLGEEL